jgi:hypothetical protein
LLSVLKMEVAGLYETLVPVYQTTWRHIRQDGRQVKVKYHEFNFSSCRSDVQTFTVLRNSFVHEDPAQVGIDHKCCQVYMPYQWGLVEIRSLKHTGTWLAAAWPPRRLCYRPIVFFSHCFHYRKRKKKWAHFLNVIILSFYLFINCVSLELRRFKFGKSRNVCERRSEI